MAKGPGGQRPQFAHQPRGPLKGDGGDLEVLRGNVGNLCSAVALKSMGPSSASFVQYRASFMQYPAEPLANTTVDLTAAAQRVALSVDENVKGKGGRPRIWSRERADLARPLHRAATLAHSFHGWPRAPTSTVVSSVRHCGGKFSKMSRSRQRTAERPDRSTLNSSVSGRTRL